MIKSLLVSFLIVLCLCGSAFAATYYITQSGAGEQNGSNCPNAHSMSWAMSSTADGDLILLCDDIYNITRINPPAQNQTWRAVNACSGSPGSYSGAVFNGTTYGFDLDEEDDGTVLDGICFENTNSAWGYLNGSDSVVIKNCHFYIAHAYSGLVVGYGSTSYDFEILDNTFENGEPTSSSSDMPSDQIRLQYAERGRIEGNWFGNARHANISQSVYHPSYIIIRNNVFANKWHAHAAFGGSYYLVENNIFYDTILNGNPYEEIADSGGLYATSSDHIIARYNRVWDNEYGLYIGYTYGYDSGPNYFYHNTFYNNWMQVVATNNSHATHYWHDQHIKNNIFSLNSPTKPTSLTSDTCFIDGTVDAGDNGLHFISCANSSVQSSYYTTNEFSYNLFQNMTDYIYYPNTYYAEQSLASVESTRSEWHDNVSGDPDFNDAANDDFTIGSSSDAIDAGTFLATLTDNPTGNTFPVDDAGYLYDGWGISGEVGDTIYSDKGASAVITSINYSTNVITVDSATGFADGDQITNVAYRNNAPDIGAYEYEGEAANNAPVCVIDTPSSPYAVSASTEWAQGITATCTDADGDSLTYSWSISTNAIAAWDSGRTYSVGHLVLHSGVYYKATSGSTNVSPPSPSYWDDYADQLEDPGEPWSGASAGSYNFILTANDGTDDSTPVILVEVIGEPDPPVITYQSTTLADGAYNDDDGNITAISTHFTESVTVTSVPQQIVFLSNNSTAYPNDISHANWVKTRATVASGQKSFEEGTTISNCGAIVASVDDNNHNIRSEYISATEGDTYVMDVWLSEGALDWARIMIGQYESDYTWSSGHYCDVDVSNGTVGTCSSGVYGAYYGEDSDGWVHFSIMATITDATPDVAYVSAVIFPAEADTDVTFIGDASSNYTYVCGAEIYKRIALLDYSSGSPGADILWENHTIADGDNIDRLDLGPIYFEGTDAIEATDDSTTIDQSVIYDNSLRGLHNIRIDTDHPSYVEVVNDCTNCTADGNVTSQGLLCIEYDWDEDLECSELPSAFTVSTSGMEPSDITGYNWGVGDDSSRRVICFDLDDKYRISDFATATSLSVTTACTDAAGNSFESTNLDSIADSAAINVAIPGYWTVCASQCDETDIGDIDSVTGDFIRDYTTDGSVQSFDGDNLVIWCMAQKAGSPDTWTFTGSGCRTYNCERKGMTISGATDISRGLGGFFGF